MIFLFDVRPEMNRNYNPFLILTMNDRVIMVAGKDR
jgi:hypothetical protein